MPQDQKTLKNQRGRPKGSPNKVTLPLRTMMGSFLERNWREVERSFKKLEAKDKIQAYEKILSYYLPKLQSVSHTSELESYLNKLEAKDLEEVMNKILDAWNLKNHKI